MAFIFIYSGANSNLFWVLISGDIECKKDVDLLHDAYCILQMMDIIGYTRWPFIMHHHLTKVHSPFRCI